MADTDSIIVRTGKDLKLDNALQVGSNESVALPGTMRYNADEDRFEGYLTSTNPYNNSKWAFMSMGIASDTTLGGVKVGNNLGITSDGILNATAEAVSQKVQRILLVAQPANAGDYTSINQCITQFFGYDPINNTFPNGELASLNKINYPDPSPQNRYVIKVTPGIYAESDTTIALPPYVSLIGENRADCIIKMDASVTISCRDGNYIGELTIDLTNANAGTAGTIDPVGISANTNANSVVISGVDIITTQLGANTTCIDYRGGVTGGLIENCRITANDLALPTGYTNETITGILCNNATVSINDTLVELEGYRASKTTLKVLNGASVHGNGLRLNVTELNTTSSGHQNDAILVTNADLELNYSQISCQGYDILLNDDTHQCQGINMTSSAVAASVTLADIQFIHYEDASQYDEIMVEASTQDFAELFARDSYIKVSGAISQRNNRVFQIANIYSENISGTSYSIIQLVSGDTLEDETVASGSVTIKELYLVQLNSSRLTATNSTLRFTPSSGQITNLDNYQIISSRTLLNGGDPNVGANNLRTDRLQLITVGQADSDFNSLKTAVDSITARGDNSAEKPYVINIRPGKYLETGTIAVPSWISITGDSVGATELEFNNSSGAYAQNTAITLAGNSTIENVTLRVNDTLDVTSSQSNVTVISTNNLTGITLGDSGSEAGADNLANIRLLHLDIILGPNIATTGERQGIHLFKTNADIRDVHITATTGDINEAPQVITGYKQTLGDTKVYNLDVTISGSESNVTAYGAMLDRAFVTANNPQILCACDGITDIVNRGWFATNLANTDESMLTVSGFTNILVAGSIRASGSTTTNQCLFADYNSTIVARSLLMQGTAFTYNDSQNSVPNSFLKTLDSYFISISGGLITNISESDTRGYPVIINDSLHIGDPAGSLGAQGEKNVIVGIRAGTRSTQTTRTTILGVDTGDQVETGTDVTYLGYGTGANTLGSLNVMIGSNAGFDAVDSERVAVVGANAYRKGNNMNDSVVMGSYAGSNVYNSNNLVLLGANVAPNVDDARDLLVMGAFAGSNITGLSNAIVVGSRAGNKLTSTGDDSVIIGHEAAQTTEGARTVTIMGSQAGQFGLQALDNTLIGYRAGRGVSSGATGNKITAVGVRAASGLTSGAELVAIGTGALQSVTSGRRVIAIGSELLTAGSGSGPAAALTMGQDDTVIGSNSATALTTGDRVVVMGHNSANKLDGTNDMIVIGNMSASNFSGSAEADGQSIVIGNKAGVKQQLARAIIVGHEAAQNANAEDLIAIGYKTARTVKGAGNMIMGNFAAGITNDDVVAPLSGVYNVVMGNYAGFSMSSGSFNVVIGGGNQSLGSAGYDLTTGEGNVLMGYLSGRNLSTGDFNLLMGKNAGQRLAWGSRNFIMGADAAANIGLTDVNPSSMSSDNLILGTQAAFKYTSGSQLLIVGYQAGYNGTTGQNSVIVGNQAGFTNQVGRDIVYIGNKSGYLNTNSRNIAIGYGAAEYSSTAERFVYIGYRAGRGKGASQALNNTGDRSVMIGYQAGSNVTTGYQDVYIGYEAGMNNEEGQKNIMIGTNAGRDSTTNRSVFIGTTESSTTGIGQQATGDNLICIGVNTGIGLTTGTKSVLIGSHAGESVASGDSHVFIGYDAGSDVTTGDSSIFVGELAGKSSVSGSRNIAVGKNAGRNMGAEASDVILMGTEAGLNVGVDGTIAVGNKAAKMLTTGRGVIAIGDEAARDNETASDLIAIGSGAGRLTTGVGGESDSILIGDQAGSNLTTSYQNTVLGSRALKDATTANAVIAIGYEAGQRLGSTNNVKPVGSQYETTIIGYQAISSGDIGANCTIIGNRAGQNVDNPRVFEGNTFNGPRAGQNANTSVNSVVLGGANQQGSGGVSNFIAGSGTGANVGISHIPQAGVITTTTVIANRGMNVVVNAPLSSVYYYFKDGDVIMIEASDQSQFHETVVASLQEVTKTTTRIVFSTPFVDKTNNGETISTGASVRQKARLSELIGELDDSKASANTLQGTEAGTSLDEGSKNVAAGYQAMFNNIRGKYNNVFGSQAAYHIRTDGSTCIGTRAGYSLDQYTYTNNTIGVDLTFDSNTNTISSSMDILSGFKFGTVFEVEGSSRNDGRYTFIRLNRFENKLVIQGSPRLEETGVPISIEDGDIRINANTYDFIKIEITGEGLKAGTRIQDVIIGSTHYQGLSANGLHPFNGSDDTSNIAKLEQLSAAKIIQINGSKYNDGIYYGYYGYYNNSKSLPYTYNTYNLLNAEEFDSNVTITSSIINVFSGITSGNNFYDFDTNAPFKVFFGTNKGVYRQSAAIPKPLGRDNSNLVLLSNSDIFTEETGVNDIFRQGISQDINLTVQTQNGTFVQSSLINLYKPNKLQMYQKIIFDGINNNIIFTNHVTLSTGRKGYYTITGTQYNNKSIKIYTTSSQTIYSVDPSVKIITETVYADSSNVVIFAGSHFFNLNKSIVPTTINIGQIIYASVEHLCGLKVDKGAFITSSKVDSDKEGIFFNTPERVLNLVSDQILPESYNRVSVVDSGEIEIDIKLLITPESLTVDSGYLNDTTKHIHGYDFFFQTANIAGHNGATFTLNQVDGTITANDRYQFSRLVAPCVIKTSANDYYLVKYNDYPFKKLVIDTDATPIFLTMGSTITYIKAHSITCHRPTANLAIMEAGKEYQIFGGNKNNNVKVMPVSGSARAIQKSSVYLTDNSEFPSSTVAYSDIKEHISNNKVLSVSTRYSKYTMTTIDDIEYDHDERIDDILYVKGYFKRVKFDATNVDFSYVNAGSGPIMRLTFNDYSIDIFHALAQPYIDRHTLQPVPEYVDTVPITVDDLVKITGSGNNDCTRQVVAINNSLEPPYILDLALNSTGILEGLSGSNVVEESGQNIVIEVNEFKFTDLGSGFSQGSGMNMQLIRELTGSASDFLRFTTHRVKPINGITNYFGYANGFIKSLTDVELGNRSLNFTVDYWDDFNGYMGEFNTGANINAVDVVYLTEPVPMDYTAGLARTGNIFNTYILSLGTPVLPAGSNIILQQENIHMPPIGFIDAFYYKDATNIFNSTDLFKTQDLITGPIAGNISLSTNGIIKIEDIGFDKNATISSNYNVIASRSLGTLWQDPTNGPFKYVKPGTKLTLVYREVIDLITSPPVSESYVIKEVIDGNQILIDPRESTIDINRVLQFDSVSDSYSNHISIQLSNLAISQVVSDRYNFATFNASSPNFLSSYYSEQLKYTKIFMHELDIVGISSNVRDSFVIDSPSEGQHTSLLFPRINYGSLKSHNNFIVDDDNIQKGLCFDQTFVDTTSGNILPRDKPLVDNEWAHLDKGDHLWIIPTSNIVNGNLATKLSFASVTPLASLSDPFTFTTSNTIIRTGMFPDLSGLSPGQIIKISGATDANNNGFFKISSTIAPTSSIITLDSTYGNLPLTSRTDDTGITITTNTINSSDPVSSNLAVFLPGQKLIINKTINNNGVFVISPDAPTSNNSIYLLDPVVTENPQFCNIEKSIIVDETSTFTGDNDTTFDPTSNIIVTTSTTDDFTEFVPGQTIIVSGTTNNDGTYTLENIIPGEKTLFVTVSQTEVSSSAVISKKITLIKLGEPAVSVSDTGTKQFHYLDAQGNHLMLGSFAGQFTGATALAVHNTHIGGQVGQTNQGSGNILLGNETGRAVTSTQGATNYNNKLAIYKQDFVGVPSQPLIGGDFGSGRVGINTIDPDSFVSGSMLTTATKLVINGAARASSFNTFTGTHMVDLTRNIMRKVKPGMILKSVGTSRKLGIIDTVVQCDIADKAMDKTVYGVYCHTDIVCKSSSDPDEPLASRVSIEIAYCASVGEGCMLVCDIGGELENGDYVMSSPIAGYGQLQPDDMQHTYTVAKITEDIDWSNENIGRIGGPDGKMYKTVLASCTYHCG